MDECLDKSDSLTLTPDINFHDNSVRSDEKDIHVYPALDLPVPYGLVSRINFLINSHFS